MELWCCRSLRTAYSVKCSSAPCGQSSVDRDPARDASEPRCVHCSPTLNLLSSFIHFHTATQIPSLSSSYLNTVLFWWNHHGF